MKSYSSFGEVSLFQKIKSMDFYLLFSLILLGAISVTAMYSTDISDGNFYHSFNHALRFGVFFTLMIFLSLINIKYYFSLGSFSIFSFYCYLLLQLFWYDSPRLTKMDKLILYKFTTIRINENSNYSFSRQVLSQSSARCCKYT